MYVNLSSYQKRCVLLSVICFVTVFLGFQYKSPLDDIDHDDFKSRTSSKTEASNYYEPSTDSKPKSKSSTHASDVSLFYLSEKPDDIPTQRLNYTFFNTTQDGSGSVNSGSISATTTSLPSPLANCPITSQLRIRILRSKAKKSTDNNEHQGKSPKSATNKQWILETLDINGDPKSIGGDEFYITYHDETVPPTKYGSIPPRAVANIQDMQDGTYQLSFTSVPNVDLTPGQESRTSSMREETNYIQVYLVYTCGMGIIPPPLKDLWNNGGFILTTYTVYDIPIPPIEEFVAPLFPLLHSKPTSETTSHSSDEEHLDLSSYDKVICLGDSNMANFCSHHKVDYGPTVKTQLPHLEDPLNNETVDSYTRKAQQLLRRHWEKIKDKPDEEKSIAMVMGSGTWDLLAETVPQGPTFDNHLQACRRVIEIMTDFIKLPRFASGKITLVWKSPVAHHVHQVIGFPDFSENQGFINRIKYASVGRSHYLYMKQKALMEDLGVPFLDIYPTTYLSAFYHKPFDVRHYKPQLNFMMLNLYFVNKIDVGPKFRWRLEPKYQQLKFEGKEKNKALNARNESWSPL